ncbi:hypothetical protein FRC03_006155 [Tulasnella sp. 419]|nr:hypothetical protein FRC02_009377 [Tulasnella sp. 418]KAG8960761.1 hypothetical protein FRC03_006155 [Tulasnella sp. 419]
MLFLSRSQPGATNQTNETRETIVRRPSQEIAASLLSASQGSPSAVESASSTVQVVDMTNELPQAPAPVVVTQHRTMTAAEEFNSRFDDFFGTPRRSPSPPSSGNGRRNRAGTGRPTPSTTASLSSSSPPPYGTPDYPAPAYEEIQEPLTIAKYLFRYGFVFPPFWFIGTMILFMRLPPTPEGECGKTAEEQAEELAILRRAELRWSRYCAAALVLFLVALAALFVGLYFGGVLKTL